MRCSKKNTSLQKLSYIPNAREPYDRNTMLCLLHAIQQNRTLQNIELKISNNEFIKEKIDKIYEKVNRNREFIKKSPKKKRYNIR